MNGFVNNITKKFSSTLLPYFKCAKLTLIGIDNLIYDMVQGQYKLYIQIHPT